MILHLKENDDVACCRKMIIDITENVLSYSRNTIHGNKVAE